MIIGATQLVACLAMAIGGIILAILALGLGLYILGAIGAQMWHRMRRIYRLATIWHYLDQLEKTGRYHFPPPDKDNP